MVIRGPYGAENLTGIGCMQGKHLNCSLSGPFYFIIGSLCWEAPSSSVLRLWLLGVLGGWGTKQSQGSKMDLLHAKYVLPGQQVIERKGT